MTDQTLYLASQSPRRSQLLGERGIPFRILQIDVDEGDVQGETPDAFVCELAARKARAGARKIGEGLVLGADTMVFLDENPLGKPRDRSDARRLLGRLSGRWHQVLTGIALCDGAEGPEWVASETTEVLFRKLSEGEIADYVASGEPMGKAGAYAIQGGAASFVLERRGSLSNVIGLPLERLETLLAERARSL